MNVVLIDEYLQSMVARFEEPHESTVTPCKADVPYSAMNTAEASSLARRSGTLLEFTTEATLSRSISMDVNHRRLQIPLSQNKATRTAETPSHRTF